MSLTRKEIRQVARRTIEKLEEGGYKCCVFGSAACSIWGMDRVPNVGHFYLTLIGTDLILTRQDVDIVVFGQKHDAEEIKAYLEDASDRFTLEDARNPKDTYKVLYFNLSYPQRKRCKVDILVSGRKSPLHIPRIPETHVAYLNHCDIPVMPFLVLLILKVQGWKDHKKSDKPWHRKKISQDNHDIWELLNMLDDNDHLDNYDWLPRWFVKGAEGLVGKYMDKHLYTTSAFESLGFSFYN